jgi:spoIIIJ-associated protein
VEEMMSEVIEFEAKNVEKALEKASEALDLPVDKINHEVVTHGSSGIFGLVGVKKAKIKVFVLKKPEKKEDRWKSRAEKEAMPKKKTAAEKDNNDRCEEELLDYGKTALSKIVAGISKEADIGVEQKKGKLIFTVSDGESGVLIGKRGQTLEAIQYLLEKMINKKSGNRVRVLVDVEGYLAKRKNNLQQMARRMAEKAKRTQKPVTIGQMNAHDRRVVHIQLKDEKSVRTQSIGDGYYRKLMIFPKKQGGSSRSKKRSAES